MARGNTGTTRYFELVQCRRKTHVELQPMCSVKTYLAKSDCVLPTYFSTHAVTSSGNVCVNPSSASDLFQCIKYRSTQFSIKKAKSHTVLHTLDQYEGAAYVNICIP